MKAPDCRINISVLVDGATRRVVSIATDVPKESGWIQEDTDKPDMNKLVDAVKQRIDDLFKQS
jgi:hypothetical protein